MASSLKFSMHVVATSINCEFDILPDASELSCKPLLQPFMVTPDIENVEELDICIPKYGIADPWHVM
jgi:hypothetical protein